MAFTSATTDIAVKRKKNIIQHWAAFEKNMSPFKQGNAVSIPLMSSKTCDIDIDGHCMELV